MRLALLFLSVIISCLNTGFSQQPLSPLEASFRQYQAMKTSTVTASEEKLKEANFQRQQLQKKISYLEELSRDMAAMSEANKSLENQIRRIGELESLLNVTEEERDRLKNQPKQ